MSKILITGATGFIATPLIRALREQGHILSGTTRKTGVFSGTNGIPLHKVPEISENTDWSNIISGAEVVIHLAARVHIMKDQSRNPIEAFRRVNTLGTKSLALQAANAGIKRFIFLSTVKVAGETSPIDGFKESGPISPNDPYSISKYEAEQELLKIAQSSSMEVVIIRPPLVYGPNVKGNFLSLLKLAKKNYPLPLNSINNKRSLIFVDNLTDAITKAVDHPKAANKIFFLSDEENLSTTELINKISRAFGTKARIFNIPQKYLILLGKITGNTAIIKRLTQTLTVDSTRIKSDLNWSPPFQSDVGIEKTVNWYNRSLLEKHGLER
ncbi:MAG: NAD-dependent epimerase/dehydratase family protein [Rhodospirillales bacterium]|tara:strand:- start:590 stop:1570 length:981 start_codon:yes stop_codon:yes gene_type:complete